METENLEQTKNETNTTPPTTTKPTAQNCMKCGHIWTPRKAVMPKECPKCKNYSWTTPRKNKVQVHEEAVVPTQHAQTQPIEVNLNGEKNNEQPQ